MRRVCVFCGSNPGTNPLFKSVTQELGRCIAKAKLELVYGGGHVGLMGIVADAVLEAGGKVIGVMPESLLAKEIGHRGLTELKVVKSMHERKALMAELSDGFIALPGGFGTMEEFCEIITWAQLGFHKKPCAILNIDGFYDQLLKFFDKATECNFIKEPHRNLVLVSTSPSELLQKLQGYKHTTLDKWVIEKRT